MIRQQHSTRNYVFRLFNTKEAAAAVAMDTSTNGFPYKEVPVEILGGWVLVSSVRPKECRDEWGSLIDKAIILEIENLFYEQYNGQG